MRPTAWIAIAIILFTVSIAVFDQTVQLVTSTDDGDSTRTTSGSGLEFIENELTMLRGCADNELVAWDETNDEWGCAVSTTTGMVLDIDDDDVNETTGLAEIATTGDTNGIFHSTTTDKLLIRVGNNWPVSASTTAFTTNPSNCTPAGLFAGGIDALGAAEGCAGVALDIGNDASQESTGLTEIATTGDTNSIFTSTSTNRLLIDASQNWLVSASTTSFTTNPTNCGVGSYARGIDTLGAAENCTADDDIPEAADYTALTGGHGVSHATIGTLEIASTTDYTWTGTHRFSSSTEVSIPISTGGATVDADGEITIDYTTATINFFATSSEWLVNPTMSRGVMIETVIATDDFPLIRMLASSTLTMVCYLCVGGTNWVGQLQEFDTNGLNGTNVHSADVTALAGIVNCQNTFSNATASGGNWIGINTASISGTPTSLHITFYYDQDP